MIEAGFDLITRSSPAALLVFFWYFFILELPRYTLSTVAVAIGSLRARHLPALPRNIPVSVLVVGMSEPEGLRRTIRSLQEQTHQNLQIVVVEDGGDSAMSLLAKRYHSEGVIAHYIATGIRGGKAAALNLGFSRCLHEHLVVLDIDSSLDRDAIEWILRRLRADPEVGAVSGNLGVRNPGDSPWAAFQALEYLSGISMGRQFLAMFNLLTIVSGAFGAFRRSAIEHVGGW